MVAEVKLTSRAAWRMAWRDRNSFTDNPVATPAATVTPVPGLRVRSRVLAQAVAASGGMAQVLGQIHAFAPAETVVFEGATGTGKSYLAQALHEASGRKGAFVDVSAGEFEPGLALDQFFGHVRGAFTGAMSRHRGLFAEAEGGTLLIDEFQLLPRGQQAMLIRALERRVYRPIGYERDVPVTCSVVVGVEESLDRLVAAGRIRANVRSRLGHCIVRVPTLDERRDEIASYAHEFLSQCPVSTHAADGPTRFGPDALGVLEMASYPANLRDLREVVKVAYLQARGAGEVRVEHLPEWIRVPLRYDRRMDRATKQRLAAWAVRTSGGHLGRAGERIGAHRNTVAALVGRLPEGTDSMPKHYKKTHVGTPRRDCTP
jgi:DNA-binding NtrC family response regulator